MKLLDAESAKRARSVGLPVLLDSRTEEGRPVLRRAGEREVPGNANALKYIAGVRGTSAGVAQFYEASPTLTGHTVTVAPDLTEYDKSQLPALKAARIYR